MSQLSSINHIVVLMLENRSFDHMLGFLYSDSGNKSPAGKPKTEAADNNAGSRRSSSAGDYQPSRHEMPVLHTNGEYRTYIEERMAAWKGPRKK